MLKTLDMSLTYETDQIVIVEPIDFSKLKIEEGKDYCSLVTCTPYGINTHRLIIRGHRIENKEVIKDTNYNIYYLLLFIIVLIIVRFVLKKYIKLKTSKSRILKKTLIIVILYLRLLFIK